MVPSAFAQGFGGPSAPETQYCFSPQQIDYYHRIIDTIIAGELGPEFRDFIVNGFYPFDVERPITSETPRYGDPYDLATCGSRPDGLGSVLWYLSISGPNQSPIPPQEVPLALCCDCSSPAPVTAEEPADPEKFRGTLNDYGCLTAEQGTVGSDGNVRATIDVPESACSRETNFDALYGPSTVDSTYLGEDGETTYAKCSFTRPLCPCGDPGEDVPEDDPEETPEDDPTESAGAAEKPLFVCMESDTEIVSLRTGERFSLNGLSCPRLPTRLFRKEWRTTVPLMTMLLDYRRSPSETNLARLKSEAGLRFATNLAPGSDPFILYVRSGTSESRPVAEVETWMGPEKPDAENEAARESIASRYDIADGSLKPKSPGVPSTPLRPGVTGMSSLTLDNLAEGAALVIPRAEAEGGGNWSCSLVR